MFSYHGLRLADSGDIFKVYGILHS